MRVAVIGGGYAGMAAAIALADAGVAVTVYEAARELGGRARRVVVNGVALDNGCHILLGAYRDTLRLVGRVHPHPDRALTRLPLDWRIHRRFHLKARPLPPPLHLAAGLLTARGAPWRERLGAARFMNAMRAQRFRIPHDTSVADLLAQHGQGDHVVRYLWQPLCVAALNTPAERASARVFLHVLRDGLLQTRASSDVLLARQDLSSLFPEPAAEYVRARGGTVFVGHTVDSIEREGRMLIVTARGGRASFDHVICAVSPHRAVGVLEQLPELAETVAAIQRLRFQPIYSVYLQLERPCTPPAPMLGLSGTAQWLFDRQAICGQRALLAAVISAEGSHQNVTQETLAQTVYDEVASELGELPPLAWHRVIAEKRATFECSVDLERPATRTALANVHLAGDYTAGDHPATIEAAVRSGLVAAQQVLEPQL